MNNKNIYPLPGSAERLRESLYRWYAHHHRVLPWREESDPYRIWISEIILQQTRVVQGMEYYVRFISRFPDVYTLAEADEAEVLRYWQGLGYYSRARNLHKSAKLIIERGWAPFPTTWEEIRQLPGVGDYTAGAIASFAYNLPYPAMDGNVYRVVARLFDCEMAFDTSRGKKYFHSLIEHILDKKETRLFNSAIMEFGALYCTPLLYTTEGDMVCATCPIGAYCLGHLHHTAALLPVRKPRPTLRDRYLNYYVYVCQTDRGINTLIQQRTKKDIWQHLYEFPLIERDRLMEVAELSLGAGMHVVRTMEFTHVLSHQRLHARFFVITTDRFPSIEGSICIPMSAMDAYAFSRLTLRAMETLLGR